MLRNLDRLIAQVTGSIFYDCAQDDFKEVNPLHPKVYMMIVKKTYIAMRDNNWKVGQNKPYFLLCTNTTTEHLALDFTCLLATMTLSREQTSAGRNYCSHMPITRHDLQT